MSDAVNGRKDPRAVIRDVGSELHADLEAWFRQALQAEKEIGHTCPHCSKWSKAAVPDWGASAKVVQLMLEQGWGRAPAAASEEGNVTLVVQRMCRCPAGDCDEARERDGA